MSKLTEIFTDIAVAIRNKGGFTSLMTPVQMSDYINSIPDPVTGTNVYSGSILNISDDTNMYYYFANNTNSPDSYPSITFSENVTSLEGTFYNCATFNGKVIASNGALTTMVNAFAECPSFNQTLIIPDSVTNIDNIITNCSNFNQSVILGDGVTSIANLFKGVPNFNSNVYLTESVTNIANLFENTKFNKDFTIPGTVKDASGLFCNRNSASSYIGLVTIENGVENISGMFHNCSWGYGASDKRVSLNIPNSVTNIDNLFSNIFRYPNYTIGLLNIPGSITSVENLMSGGFAVSSNILFKGNMLETHNIANDAHIFFMGNCDSLNAYHLVSGSGSTNIICGNPQPFLGTDASNSIFGATSTINESNLVTNGYYIVNSGSGPGGKRAYIYPNSNKILKVENETLQNALTRAGFVGTNVDFGKGYGLVEFSSGANVATPFSSINMRMPYYYGPDFDGTVMDRTYAVNTTNLPRILNACVGDIIPPSVKTLFRTFQTSYSYSIPVIDELTIPGTVRVMDNVFSMYINVKNLYLEEGIQSIDNLFTSNNMKPSSEFKFPNTVVNLHNVFNNQSFVTGYNLPSSLRNVGGLYRQCSNFNDSISIPSSVQKIESLVMSCSNFNSSINFEGENVEAITYLVGHCSNFNLPVTLPNGLKNVQNLFYGCSNFNQSIDLPDSVVNSYYAFAYMINFDSSVTLSNNLESACYMFTGCSKFNQPITLPSTLTNVDGMFYSCYNFNQPLSIPNSLKSGNNFISSTAFNAPITFAEDIHATLYSFMNCPAYNQPYNVPSGINVNRYFLQNAPLFNLPLVINSNFNGDAFIGNARNFNCEVVISEGVVEFNGSLFNQAVNFSNTISLPSTLTKLGPIFAELSIFNSPVTLNEGITDISYLFRGCTNFNQNIVLPSTLINAPGIFSGCSNFNQPVAIPASVTNIYSLFYGTQFDSSDFTLGDNIVDASYLFCRSNFTGNFHLGPNTINLSSALSGTRFNHPIDFNSSKKLDLSYLFNNCKEFNQPIDADYVQNSYYMFNNCEQFNSDVTINHLERGGYTFSYCNNFNGNVTLNHVSNAEYMFSYCNNFNGNVTLKNAEHVAYMFYATNNYNGNIFFEGDCDLNYCMYGVKKFNKPLDFTNVNGSVGQFFGYAHEYSSVFNSPVVFGDGITNVSNFFAQANNFNTSVTFGNNYCNMSGCFYYASNFNQPVIIPENATNISRMFYYCNNMNQTIEVRAKNCDSMEYAFYFNRIDNGTAKIVWNDCVERINARGSYVFDSMYNFNEQVNLPANLVYLENMFSYIPNFNQPLVIPANCKHFANFTTGAPNFNSEITISNGIEYLGSLMYGAYNYNLPIAIPSSVTEMVGTFYSWSNFNQPVTLPENLIMASGIFSGCSNFNQSVTIPASVTNASNMFYGCSNLNSDITIEKLQGNIYSMFYGTYNFSANINIKDIAEGANCYNFIPYPNYSLVKNIRVTSDSIATQFLLGTAPSDSIIGNYITWTPMTNGYFNETTNIYIYTNYVPE